MPSVRIKRSNYSSLNDNGPFANPQLPSASTSPIAPSSHASPEVAQRRVPRTQKSLPNIPPLDSPGINDLLVPPSRPRSGSTASRVHSHLMRNSIRQSGAAASRYSRAPIPAGVDSSSVGTPGSPKSPSLSYLTAPSGRMTIEGSQADILLPSGDGQTGAIGAALSRTHSQAEDARYAMGEEDDHHDEVVDHLDVIDPQVSTVSTLTNAANAILIPPLSWYSRRPVVVLTAPQEYQMMTDEHETGQDRHDDALDRHVADLLKRPSKYRRTMQGVWSFLKTPMGIITAIYGFLVVFWGAAIVIFLAKIINFHNANTQGFWVEVSSQIENGLFTVTGIGLIPSRVLDTFRIYKIWHYKNRTRTLRKKHKLPQLFDVDDLPDPIYDPNYVHVLTDAEQEDLHKQQVKFHHSQTWYRAHGTETHRAFPINTALLICLLNDGNSFFQIILCGTMWGLNRFQRPAWSTGILIPCSFLCGIGAAVCIWKGGQKTKRVDAVRKRLEAALAAEYPDNEHDERTGLRPRVHIRRKIPNQENIAEEEPVVDELMVIQPGDGQNNRRR